MESLVNNLMSCNSIGSLYDDVTGSMVLGIFTSFRFVGLKGVEGCFYGQHFQVFDLLSSLVPGLGV
jgi:hypothetical protein